MKQELAPSVDGIVQTLEQPAHAAASGQPTRQSSLKIPVLLLAAGTLGIFGQSLWQNQGNVSAFWGKSSSSLAPCLSGGCQSLGQPGFQATAAALLSGEDPYSHDTAIILPMDPMNRKVYLRAPTDYSREGFEAL